MIPSEAEYIEREIKEKFDKISKVYPIVAIVGARQSGKTTFLKNQIKNKNASYLLFDDPDVRGFFEEDIKKFENQYLTGKEVSVLDEVQYCESPGGKLKYLADTGKKIWVTSSSETILNKKVLSYLVGRVSIFRLYPFSINEFLRVKSQKELNETILQRIIFEHALYGGYPKAVIIEDIETKKTILRDLFDTMVLKDIARTFSIEDISSLELFTKYLSLNIGGIVSYEKISKELNLSFQTIRKYLDAMEKSYLIYKTIPFFKNKNKEIIKQPKIYFIDTGLRNLIAKEFNEISGKIFENYVLSELLKKGFSPKYWRTKAGNEIDFVIEKESEIIPIEVKISSEKTEKNLSQFIEEYSPKRAFVIQYKGKNKTLKIKNCDVYFSDILETLKKLNSP